MVVNNIRSPVCESLYSKKIEYGYSNREMIEKALAGEIKRGNVAAISFPKNRMHSVVF